MMMASCLLVAILSNSPAPQWPEALSCDGHQGVPGLWVAQQEDEDEEAPRRRRPGLPGLPTQNLKELVRRGTSPLRRENTGERETRAGRPAPPRGKPSPRSSVPVPAPSGAAEAPKVNIDYDARAKKGRFSFDFSKAEVMDIVKAIAEITRRNFIIPEKLKSQRITILSPNKISSAEAYQVFLSALEVNGITLVRAGKFYKLVKSRDAVRQPIPTCVGDDSQCPRYSDQMVTVLIQLKHIDAGQVNSVVKGLVSKEGEVTLFQPTNALIVSEFAPNLTRIRRILEALDVPGFDDELQIVTIEHATASEIADKLTQIFEIQGGSRSSKKSRPGVKAPRHVPGKRGERASDGGDQEEVHISKIVADDRTNQIIIKANRKSFDHIRKLIAKLDIPVSEGTTGRVHVVRLVNASAEDLASTLSSLAQGSSRRPGRQRGARPQDADIAATLFEGEIKVTADASTNSLLILASGRDFLALRRIIEKLDVPRRQVYVEAAILEVTVNDTDAYVLDWHFPFQFSEGQLGKKAGGEGSLGFMQSGPFGAQAGSAGISPTLAPLTPQGLVGIAGGTVAGVIGKGLKIPVGDGTLTLPSFGVILKWLETSSSAQVLSTPHILTTDNEEASIEVGQRIPFMRGTMLPNVGNIGTLASSAGVDANTARSFMGGFGGYNPYSSTERIDVALKLTLTPQINEGNMIRLEIQQEIEDVVGEEPKTGQPITANRSAKTVVVIEDQQTVVLGGLMRDRAKDSESKVPILGDLPLVGWLFKKKSKDSEKVNLLLVLTPYIIQDASDFQRIFERKMKEYEEFASEYYGDLAEYRAHIDYTRKNGPLAHLVAAVNREREKIENGGSGLDRNVLITPETPPAEEVVPPDLSGGGEDTEYVGEPISDEETQRPAALEDSESEGLSPESEEPLRP